VKDATITLVTDQLPFPPRNGITLPIFNYLEHLRSSHTISVCLLRAQQDAADLGDLQANQDRYGPIRQINLRRRPQIGRVFDELRGAEMLQHGWESGPIEPGPVDCFEQVLVSPMSAVAKWRGVMRANPSIRPRAMVAAVNDCTAAEYHNRLRAAQVDWASRGKAWLDRARTPLIGRIESALLADYRRVLVQTQADRDAICRWAGADTARRCMLAPNGVRPDLFDLQPIRAERVAFVAELSGEYGPLAHWLCTQVWPKVRAQQPRATFSIVGRNPSARLKARLAETPGVEYIEFAADLASVYASAGVVWSPVFKGFGLINKTLEAMASGLAVVGGAAAFNGVQGFVDGVHGVGLSGPDPTAFARHTISLLQSSSARAEMGQAARRLVTGQFSWERTVSTVRKAFEPVPSVTSEREPIAPLALPGRH
jgi:glycosyltransferase involved in cell wall biosynthesis